MTQRIPTRPDLIGTVPRQLETTRTRVLRTPDAASTDAQRVAQANALRTNETIDRLNKILETPFGEGEMLTVPSGNGERTTQLTLVAGDNDFAHTLGRPVAGYVVCDVQGRGDIDMYRISVSRSFDERFIRLHVAHPCQLKIWVW